ncbi:hypothetical protein R1flu_026694 [Riccia fluitans]|uniref:PROP1-like PPR domain-containing protein n=1 Tax=Riccia fluitans TaxID=41844 RepID=A0ABD1XGQ1_9MARC
MTTAAVDLASSVASGILNLGKDNFRVSSVKNTESRVSIGRRKQLSAGLVRAVSGDGKTVTRTSRWVYRGRQLISQTVVQPLPSASKAEGPWKRDLLELIADITGAENLETVLQPWVSVLTSEEWNKILLEVGNRDWTLAMDVFKVFKTQSPLVKESPSNEGSDSLDFPAGISKGNSSDSNRSKRSKPSPLLRGYTTIVGVLSRKGRLSELDMIVHEMREENVEPDLRFFNGVAEAYSNLGLVSYVSQVIVQMEQSGIQPDKTTFELMIFAALKAKSTQLRKALQVFQEMLENNMEVGVKTYLKLIDACADAGDIQAADEVFMAMRSSGHTIYSKTWVKMIQLHGSIGGYKEAEEIFRALRAAGIPPSAAVYDALLLAYCHAGCLDQAFSVFREYKLATKPSLMGYNYLIEASGKSGRYEESLALYSDLCSNGLRPSTVTFTSLICAMVQAGHYEKADRLYKKMLQKGVSPNAYTYTAMIRAYTACSWTRLGHEVCMKMREDKIQMGALVYGALLNLYLQGRWYKEAAGIIKEMDRAGIEPDVAGYGVLISSLGESGEEIAPVVKAMQASDWEPCWVATFLVDTPAGAEAEAEIAVALEKIWSIFEEWAAFKDREANRSFYNAIMDALWRRGLRRRARSVMLKARDLLPWYNRPRRGLTSVLDLRGLSVGGAQVALLDWLEDLAIYSEQSTSMVIHTGSNDPGGGRYNAGRGKGMGAVKQAVTAYLEEMCSPFRELAELGPGKLQARTELVVKWLSRRDSKDALRLHDYV